MNILGYRFDVMKLDKRYRYAFYLGTIYDGVQYHCFGFWFFTIGWYKI